MKVINHLHTQHGRKQIHESDKHQVAKRNDSEPHAQYIRE
jgi:hypothetical protein